MAQVRLAIGGRSYDLACRAGEEPHYEALAAAIDAKARQVQTLGGMNEVRLLLLSALLLADDLAAGNAAAAPAEDAPPQDGPSIPGEALEALAARIEAIATALEIGGAAS